MKLDEAYRRYRSTLMRGARRLTHGSSIDAEDLLQDTLLEASRHWHKLSDHPNPIGLLKQLLHWTWVATLKRACSEKRNHGVAPASMSGSYREPSAPGRPDDVLELIDVDRKLAKVKPRVRDTMLRVAMGDTFREIADDEGRTFQAVQQRVYRFREGVQR